VIRYTDQLKYSFAVFKARFARELNAAKTAIRKDREVVARFIVALFCASWTSRNNDAALLVFRLFEFR
jgi:hypothetical protein